MLPSDGLHAISSRRLRAGPFRRVDVRPAATEGLEICALSPDTDALISLATEGSARPDLGSMTAFGARPRQPRELAQHRHVVQHLLRTADPLLPLSFFLLLLLSQVVMRLDAEEHDRAQHEQLERDEADRNPEVHDFLETLHQQLEQWFKPNRMRHGIP